jgi:hypothetical protein
LGVAGERRGQVVKMPGGHRAAAQGALQPGRVPSPSRRWRRCGLALVGGLGTAEGSSA